MDNDLAMLPERLPQGIREPGNKIEKVLFLAWFHVILLSGARVLNFRAKRYATHRSESNVFVTNTGSFTFC